MRGKTVEEVYVEMLKPKEDVRLKVQNRPEEFTKVKGLPGDSFYIRALYDRLAEVEHELSFKKDVTSSTLMTLCLRAHLGPGWPGSLTRTPRRSSEGRSPANTYSMSLAYQRVQKVDCTSLRPVPILGPLLDVVKEMLVNKTPGKFCRCPFEVMKASQQAIERGVKDCLLVDYKRRSGHFDVTTVASIREIAEKGSSREEPRRAFALRSWRWSIENKTESCGSQPARCRAVPCRKSLMLVCWHDLQARSFSVTGSTRGRTCAHGLRKHLLCGPRALVLGPGQRTAFLSHM
uniref:Guanylate kinase/L-type calcium channel beta subunit domain-containing protein n=1 Tax=Suricata suricatta TaxID=37032 RepID=A0A673V8S3_SURSU